MCATGSITTCPANIGRALDVSRLSRPDQCSRAAHLRMVRSLSQGDHRRLSERCARRPRAAHARDHQYLIAGPWVHIPWGDQIGEVNFGPEALLDTDAILLRWFNHWLKDSGEFAEEPRIRHFSLFENRWHSAEELPRERRSDALLAERGSCQLAQGRRRTQRNIRRLPKSPAMFSSTIPKFRCWRRAARARSAAATTRLRLRWATTFSSTPRSRCLSRSPSSDRRVSALYCCCLGKDHRLHRPSLFVCGPTDAPISSASGSRALTFFSAEAFTPECGPLLAVRAGADLVPLRGRRLHSSRDRQ